jgi:hypothetical protein
MAFTDKFDDAVADANDDVTGQINAAEAVIQIGVDADYYSNVLAGGRGDARDRVTMGLVDKTLDILGDDVDIRSFIDTPMPVDFLLDDVADIEPVRIRGSFTLPQFWDQIFDSGVPMGSYRDETATSVETAIRELDNWYATIDTAEDPGYPSRVAEARSTIAELTPVRDDLRGGDDEQRARGLQAYDPDALGALLAEPEGARVTVADSDLRRKVEEVDASPPRARPTAPLGTREREQERPKEEELEPGVFAPRDFDFDAARAAAAPAPADTFSPEAVRRITEATVAETAAADTFSPELARATSTAADTVTPRTTYTPGPTAAQIREANQAEVELLLAQQFGGFSFFLQKHRSDLQVGLTADGQVVAADDPNAATVKNILDVIVDQGITAPTRVLGLLENTEWWQKTDAKMREYDVLTADMSEPQKTEYLEPVLDLLREEAQFLGFELDSGRARDLAEQITRMGEENDSEYIRGLLTAEGSFNAAEVTASSFAAARDEIVAMSKRYFAPINEADAAAFAQDIYVGTKTAEGVEQYFREMAANKFPQLENSLNAGITPEQYFAPYKYEIERMLDRPNVDLYEEFGDVIQYIPDTGTGEARPMTLGEVRKYVRGLDEWQQSSQGTDSARALAFSIGRVFGEVA